MFKTIGYIPDEVLILENIILKTIDAILPSRRCTRDTGAVFGARNYHAKFGGFSVRIGHFRYS